MDFTETIKLRGLSVDELLREVLADSDSEKECSPTDNDVQSSGERESTAA